MVKSFDENGNIEEERWPETWSSQELQLDSEKQDAAEKKKEKFLYSTPEELAKTMIQTIQKFRNQLSTDKAIAVKRHRDLFLKCSTHMLDAKSPSKSTNSPWTKDKIFHLLKTGVDPDAVESLDSRFSELSPHINENLQNLLRRLDALRADCFLLHTNDTDGIYRLQSNGNLLNKVRSRLVKAELGQRNSDCLHQSRPVLSKATVNGVKLPFPSGRDIIRATIDTAFGSSELTATLGLCASHTCAVSFGHCVNPLHVVAELDRIDTSRQNCCADVPKTVQTKLKMFEERHGKKDDLMAGGRINQKYFADFWQLSLPTNNNKIIKFKLLNLHWLHDSLASLYSMWSSFHTKVCQYHLLHRPGEVCRKRR